MKRKLFSVLLVLMFIFSIGTIKIYAENESKMDIVDNLAENFEVVDGAPVLGDFQYDADYAEIIAEKERLAEEYYLAKQEGNEEVAAELLRQFEEKYTDPEIQGKLSSAKSLEIQEAQEIREKLASEDSLGMGAVAAEAYDTLLFLNGTLINDYEIIIRNDRALVPVRLIAQELGASVDWNGSNKVVTITKSQKEIVLTINNNVAFVNGIEFDLDYPAIIYQDLTYVPLRFVAENLDAMVHYSPGISPEFTYYYETQMPVSPADTIVRSFANIIIDEKYDFSDSRTKEEALKKTQAICLAGLENFSKSMRENLANSNGNPNQLDGDFKGIEKEIDRMMYIGEVSRFYKFTIGPYDILFDRMNDNIFFVIYSSGTTIKEVNINDPGLYLPAFIVG